MSDGPLLSIHYSTPHIYCEDDDPLPMILTYQIAGKETACLRYHGIAIGPMCIVKNNLFFFVLRDFPHDIASPDDYAVLYVGFIDRCPQLDEKVKDEYEKRVRDRNPYVVWVAKMTSDSPGPRSFIARPVPIGDKINGLIQARPVWMQEHYERFFAR